MSQHEKGEHKGPPELCLDCRRDRARPSLDGLEAIEIDIAWQEAKQEMARSFELAYEWAAPSPRYTGAEMSAAVAEATNLTAEGFEARIARLVAEVKRLWALQDGWPVTAVLLPGDLDAPAGAEADPDVADTAWAIIEHHARHRTAG